MSQEQQDNMLSVYIPIPPSKPLGGSIPCTCCVKCSQERLYKTSPSHERFHKTSPSQERLYRTSPFNERLYKTSSSQERLYKTSISPTESFKSFNQPIPTKTKIFKPTVLMNRHVSTVSPQQHTSSRKRTFEHYTGEQHFRKNTTTSTSTTISKLPYVPYEGEVSVTISSEKQFANNTPVQKRSSFQRQDRVAVKSVEYYEEFSKQTIEKIPLTTTTSNTKTSSTSLIVIPQYERITPSSSPSVLYESHSPSSSSYTSLIPTPPPPLLHTPSQTSPSTLRIPSLIDPKKRRLTDFKASSFDSTNSVDSSFSGSDEEEQVSNEPKAHRAVVGKNNFSVFHTW